MQQKSLYSAAAFIFSIVILFTACQKEVSVELGNNNNNNGGSGGSGGSGGGSSNTYGWSFTGNDTGHFSGCVDTAFIQAVGPAKTLTILALDDAGNTYQLSLIKPTGNITTGSYSSTQSTAIVVADVDGEGYISSPVHAFTVQVTVINDTLVTLTMNGQLDPASGSGILKITDGKLTALIGKPNPCGNSGGGSGGGGGTGNADFALEGSPGSCSTPDIQGNYIRDVALGSSNTVELAVDVTTAGNWSISTSAVNGMSFSGSGSFTNTGLQPVTLYGSGTPTLYGNNTIPITAGSSNCSFVINVDSIETAPCSPDSNTVVIQGVTSSDFTHVSGSVNSNSNYRVIANGPSADMTLEFAGDQVPAPGTYNIERNGLSDLNYGEVLVDFTAASIYWQPPSGGTPGGKVYVTLVNNKTTITLCDVAIIGGNGQGTYNKTATAKITIP